MRGVKELDEKKKASFQQSWINKKKKEWEKVFEQKDNSALTAFFSSIVDYASTLEEPAMVVECLNFLDSCYKKIGTQDMCSFGIYGLTALGFDAYQKGVFSVAEIAFKILSDSGDSSGRNNYAYMLRRGEALSFQKNPQLHAIILLREGVKEKEPFSFVNEALAFALCFGSDSDWQIADEIMKNLPATNTMSIVRWWYDIAKTGDIEGLLVHFFLLRHQKIEHSDLGSIKSIALRLANRIDGFPEWLAKDYTIETLDDVIECLNDPDFDTILEDFLKKMPCSRANVEEMLETVSALDLWPVYNKLLTDCVALLSPEELAKLKADYKGKFSIPLPSENE